MKTKSKIPALRFKGFTDAWEERRFGDTVTIERGGSPRPISKYITNSEDGLNWIKIGDAPEEGNYITHTAEKILPEGLSKTREVHPGDLILSNSMSFGKPYIMEIDGCIHDGWLLIRNDKNKFELKFLCVLLGTDNMINQYKAMAAGSTVNNLNKQLVGGTTVSFPSIPKQQQIGTFFAHLDTLISLHQRKCDQTKELKKTMLQKMFPKKGERIPEIRFPEFTDEWEEKKLGEVGETFTGLSGKTKADFGHGAGKFVTYVNVFNNPISDLKGVDSIEIDDNQKQVQYGDILITTSSETPEEVGMTSVWLGREENVYLNSFCFGFRPTTELSSYYMAYALRSHEVRKKFIILAQGISRYNISKTKVMEINIPIPSLPEQEAIGAYFQTLDQDIAQIEKKLADLKELKKTLLRQLFV
ncbi:restriction endonuclease subunit S [Streptococcus alactolyticus]|uniref:restriction endonuclease subunit S n=1 Tax=Streptococcus alactolyticus TaxID=29389 RepID=UPI003515CDA9